MGAVATESTAKVNLTRDAALALVKEARGELDNGAQELYGSHDESQRPTIAACVEIIGRLARLTEPWRWPVEETPVGQQEVSLVAIEFTRGTCAWLWWDRDQMRGLVEDLDRGDTGEPGYAAEQVYLLHVLDGIVRQLDAEQA